MGLNIGAILATLSLDSGGYKRGFLEAEAVTSTFGQTFATAVTNPVLGAISLFKQFGAAVLTSSEHLLSMAEGVARTSALTGVSVETIQSLRNVLGDMGLSAEGADAALTAFNRKLGDAKKDGGATAKSLAQLGVDITNVGTGEKALRAIFDQLSRIQDVGQRAAAAWEIFDRLFGAQILAAVKGGAKGVAELNAEMLRLGRTISGEGITTLTELDEIMDKLKGTMQGVSNTLLLEFLKGAAGDASTAQQNIASLGETIRRDLAGPAREAGEAIGAVVGAVSDLVDGLKSLGELPGFKQFNEYNNWIFGKAGDAIEWVGTKALTLGQDDVSGLVKKNYAAPARGPSATELSR